MVCIPGFSSGMVLPGTSQMTVLHLCITMALLCTLIRRANSVSFTLLVVDELMVSAFASLKCAIAHFFKPP